MSFKITRTRLFGAPFPDTCVMNKVLAIPD